MPIFCLCGHDSTKLSKSEKFELVIQMATYANLIDGTTKFWSDKEVRFYDHYFGLELIAAQNDELLGHALKDVEKIKNVTHAEFIRRGLRPYVPRC